MGVMNMIFWIVFAFLSLSHLYFCFSEMESERKITKLILMPSLILYLLISKTENYLLYIALGFSFLGDLFLILKMKHHFIYGAGSFFIAHIIYIIAIVSMGIGTLKIFDYLSISILLIIYLAFVYIIISKKTFKNYTLPVSLYILTLLIALILSFLTNNILTSIGYLVFITSDSILIINKFILQIKKRHLYIMFSYILAQVFIILGLM